MRSLFMLDITMGASHSRIARWLPVTLLCVLAYIFTVGAGSAMAALHFGGEEGSQSGELRAPSGVAVDDTGELGSSNDVFVADQRNFRIDSFGSLGVFRQAWGWNVNEAAPAEEFQNCTFLCQEGSSGSGAGQFGEEGPQGVTVDNELGSSSYGDIYAIDWSNYRVEKFDSSGKFLLMWGKEGTADGQFEWAYGAGGLIAVGPGGRVYVGDKARVEVFEPSGVWRENISLVGLSATGKVTALAVDASGNVFVKDEGVAGVHEFAADGVEQSTQFDANSNSVEALALNASGDLFVADSTGGFHVLMYNANGNMMASFGSTTAGGTNGMAFSAALGELYVSNPSGNNVWILQPPAPGPLVESGSESATPGLRGTATLDATVNPEGSETTYQFEYVDQARYQNSGFADASTSPVVSAGASFEDQLASAKLSGLTPGTTYDYRIVATNQQGTAIGPTQTVTPEPPALIEGPWATEVTSTSVTLAARINPLGANTEYLLEYGTNLGYGHVLTGDVGEGMGYTSVSYPLQEFQPGLTYHYRIVARNEVGVVEGADHTFTTQPAGGEEVGLPDGRAWELVSPPDKKGAAMEPVQGDSNITQAFRRR